MSPRAEKPRSEDQAPPTSGGATPAREETPAPWQPFVEGLRRFVRRRVAADDADDVTQEVLLRLHQGASALAEAERPEAWVYTVARRAVADHFRSRSYRERRDAAHLGEDAESLPDPQSEPRGVGGLATTGPRGFASFPGDHSVHEEVLSWLRPMAEELPKGYREALLQADFEGRTQRQVAADLGLSLSGAKSRVQRARRLLGERLQKCCRLELDASGRVVDFERAVPCDC